MNLTGWEVVGLIFASLVAGAALLTLLLGGISSHCNPDSGEATGFGVIGGLLLVGAAVIAIWVLHIA